MCSPCHTTTLFEVVYKPTDTKEKTNLKVPYNNNNNIELLRPIEVVDS